MARIFLFVLLISLFITNAAFGAHRVALVIGIDRYDNLPQDRNLQKAVGDAKAVSMALTKLGFEVETGVNVDRHEFNQLWAQFMSRLSPDDVAIFDFSGHGVEISGVNYLVLRDVPDVSTVGEQLLRDESIGLSKLLDDLHDKNPRVSVLIVDACRNNPFGDRRGRSIGSARGLAGLEAPKGSFVMYSAGLGQEALDRLGNADADPNSVYTRTLLPLLTTPGLNLSDIAKKVRGTVRDLALTVGHEQTPAYYDEIIGDFYPAGYAPSFSIPSPEELKHQAAAAAAECDRLAASPYDDNHKNDGVPVDNIDSLHAIPACRHAIATNANAPRFMYQLARALDRNGDTDEAIEWYEKAAAKGDALAMVNLGTLYDRGQSVVQNFATAKDWLEKAAALGNALALNNLGTLYYDGRGMSHDYAKAKDLFENAAALGEPNAMRNLGVAYAEGHGVKQSYATGRSWFEKAAAKGDRYAMKNLGDMYTKGYGVPRNDQKAKVWY